MLIASIDLETTGRASSWCQVLEIGIVLWESTDFVTPVADLPSFHAYVVHDHIHGEPKALAMNARILERIADRTPGYDYLVPGEVGQAVKQFFCDHAPGVDEVSPAGFNFDGFDRQFLAQLPSFGVGLAYRSLNPANLFFDPMVDAKLPSSSEVFRRAGVVVKAEDRHTALGDARATIEALRAGYNRPKDGGAVAALKPRCPDCGDRKSVWVPRGHGEAEVETLLEPCPTCNPIVTAWGVVPSSN